MRRSGWAFLLFLSGCAFLPLDSPKVPQPLSLAEPVFRAPGREAVGVIHVHSVYSDGTGTVEEITRTAQRQGLDFLILTDHNTLEGRRQGKAGRHGTVQVLIDQETSVHGGGHYLVLDASEEIASYRKADETIQRAIQVGGLGFIAHPHARGSGWKEPDIPGITGLEIYNAREDVEDEFLPWLTFCTVLFGSDRSLPQWLDRPARSLALWDRRLNRGERLVGIGATNAHGLRWLGLRLAPYGPTFKLVRNHVLIDGDLTESAVYEALEKGHLFVAHDVIADSTGFQFLAVREGVVVGVMGDQVHGPKGLKLIIYLPSPGEILLLRDGQESARASGQHLELDSLEPGVYRVEARREGRPWIYSNPIYVLE